MATQPAARQRLIDAMRARTCFCGADSCQKAEEYVDAFAHELAEQLRTESGSYGSPRYDYELGPGLARAADLIDPETRQDGVQPCSAALLPFGSAPADPCIVKGKHLEHATVEGRRWTVEEPQS
ncbi:hypothetical protein QBA57_28710 [Streptomyces scabiei]|uniref:hypothetical protein n=1 Tax=Streptomyces scabiei TaxID=1930 RepID=UPI001B32538B|nr:MULTISPECIES: hypothetical protein [Streptomyces]MBP5883150.1 hypothetical protein [Streptomyces sp. LBUM 1487]MDX2628608.1 hypothetical protein [Streptomyces scabiei]MDX3162726.1 hypothetical protein [Streptomyces scabiei]